MTYLDTARYRPGGAVNRLPVRATHIDMLDWLSRTILGGAIMDDESAETSRGLVVAIDVETRANAQSFFAAEPYNRVLMSSSGKFAR